MSQLIVLPIVVRHVLRRQRRSIAATALIVLTLALALGANTAVFSVADALLARAVPFRDPQQLVVVTAAYPNVRLAGMGLSGPEVLELQSLTTVFAVVGPYEFSGVTVQGSTEAEQANTVEISQGAVDALSISPLAGRSFAASDFLKGGAPVVMLGHAFWTRAFGGDRSIVGRTVRIGRTAPEVIGILPPGVTLLNRSVDVWLPLALTAGDAGGRADHRFHVVGRLADGRTLADATADLQRAMDVWREETGEMHTPSARMHPLAVESLTRATTGMNQEPIDALLAAVGFVLLIACANISTLLVVRAERRRADIAIQLALGASVRRLFADSVAEGLMLAMAGSLGGVAVSHAIINVLVAMWPTAANAAPALDYRVLGATAGVTVIAGLLIGIAPILRLDLVRAGDWLRTGTRGGVGGAGRLRLQSMLVTLQIALAVLLSGCAGLMVRSLLALAAIDTGIEAKDVMRAYIALPESGYRDDTQVWGFYDRLLDRGRGLPGVTHAAVMSGLPPLRRANNTSFLLDGQETVDHSTVRQVDFLQYISPGYFSVLRIPLLEGRELAAADSERSGPVTVVNRTLAERFWPGESALGHRLKPATNGPWFTVVGVVGDVRQAGVQALPGAEAYVTHRQGRQLLSGFMPRSMNVVLRTSADDEVVASSLRSQIKELDATVALSGISPLQTVIDRTIAQPRLLAWTFGAFAVLALVIAGIGVYAVTAYTANSRTSEFGLRMALGAQPADALRLVAVDGATAIGLGIVLGTTGAIGAARLLRNLLFGVQPVDPASLAIGALMIGLAAGVATMIPALRATRIDPVSALRDH